MLAEATPITELQKKAFRKVASETPFLGFSNFFTRFFNSLTSFFKSLWEVLISDKSLANFLFLPLFNLGYFSLISFQNPN